MSRYTPPNAGEGRSLVQTRAPKALRNYLRAYARHHALTMEALFEEIAEHFLTLRPDQHGLTWRKPKTHRKSTPGLDTWAQINLLLADEKAGKLAGLAKHIGISRSAVAYTALYWFARYLRPAVDLPTPSGAHRD